MTDDLVLAPMWEQAAAMARRAVSPVEILEAHLRRIERIDPVLGAFVAVLGGHALEAARESGRRVVRGEARPLEGVPVAIKDNVAVRGVPTREGSRLTADTPAPEDARIVARLRAAGAVIVGTTRLPELGTLSTTEGDTCGACRNPFDTARTAGGSSGGSAVAVATAMAAAAHGNDGGGSLRIPASCCGLFTLKPSRGRVSRSPSPGEDPLGLVVDGFLTRSVRDSALLMDLVSGPGPGDAFSVPAPQRPFSAEAQAQPGRLRIGWTVHPPRDVPVDPACADAVRAAAELCASLGHDVEEHTPAWSDEPLTLDFLPLWAVLTGADVERLVAAGARPEDAEPHNRALWDAGRRMPATGFLLTVAGIREACRRVLLSWERIDVLLCPALALPPVPLGWHFEGAAADPLAPLDRATRFTPFASVANMTGQPAVSLPLSAWNGLPVGVQAIGPPAGEALLYRLSAQLEEAAPWAARRPPFG